jgi:hypothetical protein
VLVKVKTPLPEVEVVETEVGVEVGEVGEEVVLEGNRILQPLKIMPNSKIAVNNI